MNELDYLKWNYSWDDSSMLGDFELDCPCGKRLKLDTFHIGEEKLTCECGRVFEVKRTTKVYFEEKGERLT